MNKLNFTLSIISLVALLSCNRTDFSNPEEVIKKYSALSSEYRNDVLYDDFLSSKSKEFATKDEYIKTKTLTSLIGEPQHYVDRFLKANNCG